MDTQVTQPSKHQWRYERPHRVRLFAYKSHINDIHINGWGNDALYFHAAKEFSQTDKYSWAESNGIKLDFDFDSNSIDWFKQVRFYADLSESEYVDYCLRFFDHHNETWK